MICAGRWMLLTLAIALSSRGAAAETDATRERPILAELAQRAPQAVEPFRQATLALQAGRAADAERGFRQVLLLAPGFDAALR